MTRGTRAERWGIPAPRAEPAPLRFLPPRRQCGMLKRGPAGWLVPPRRRLSRSVGWADEGSRGAGWGPAGHGEARRATGAAVIAEAASFATRRPAARVVGVRDSAEGEDT